MKRWIGLLLVMACAAAHAADGDDPMLPPASLVLQAVSATPEVHRAEAWVAAADAQARMRAVGSHEAQVTVIPQRRRVQGDRDYNEWELDVARPVRLPGKARLDREIGSAGQQAARLLLEDAHHAAARRLLAAWSQWQRARAEHEQLRQLVEIARRDRDTVARRVQLGDAAERERLATESALAQAQAALLRAQSTLTGAELAWRSEFPSVPLPERTADGTYAPPALDGDDGAWVQLIVTRSHEIGASEALARQKDAEARRARADRVADPTLGIRMLNDLGGRERAYGVVLGIPLGGSYRRAAALKADADTLAAEADLATVRRDIGRDARMVVAAARAGHAIWESRREALQVTSASAAKAARAYALGEAGIAELLAARRAEQEAMLAERQSAIDALEAVTRVQVDAHTIWHRHDDHDESSDAAGPPALPDSGG